MTTTPETDSAPVLPGQDEPALMSEDADGPTQKDLQEWAEHYVMPQSAAAFAEHLWQEWDEYEPDGTQTVGGFACDVLRQWRGEDGGYPATPQTPPRTLL